MDAASLKALKRGDLQRLAKDYGIKANLKNDTIIELILQECQARAVNDNVEGVPNPGIGGQLPTAQSIHLPSTQSARLPSTQFARLHTAQSAHARPSQVVHSRQLAMHPQGPHPSVAMGAPLPTLPPIGVLSPQVQWNLPSAAERKTSSVRTTNRPVAGCSAVSGASMNAGHHNPSGGVQAGGPGQPADAQGFARGGVAVDATSEHTRHPSAARAPSHPAQAGPSGTGPIPHNNVNAAGSLRPAAMNSRARRQAEREEEARQEAARRRLRERRFRGYRRYDEDDLDDSDEEEIADPTEADCIHMVRALRRTHNFIERECDKLLDLQDRAREIIEMSTGYAKLADVNHASAERMLAWMTYHHPIAPTWTREQIWGKDPKARVFKLTSGGNVNEETESVPLRRRMPRPIVREPTEPATPVTPPRIKKRKQVGNHLTEPRAKELFRFIQAQQRQADDEPPLKKPRLAPSEQVHAEPAFAIQYPSHDVVPRADRPLPGNWYAVDPAMAKMFFVPSQSVRTLSCGVDGRDFNKLEVLLDGANRHRVRAQLAPYAWATPRFLSRKMIRQVLNEQTRSLTNSGPWDFESVASSAIGHLTHDGHVDPGSVPFGPTVFGPEAAEAKGPAGPAGPTASTSSGNAVPTAAHSSHPADSTVHADAQQAPTNTPGEYQSTHPWYQLLPNSELVPLWYREQIHRLHAPSEDVPAPMAYDASISTGPRGASAGPRVLRIRLSTITVTRRWVTSAKDTASAAPGPSAGSSSQAAAAQPAPQSFYTIERTAQRAVFEERDPTFFEIVQGEEVHAWGLYYGDLCTPPAIGPFPGWNAWTGRGVAQQQQNGVAAPGNGAAAPQSSVSTQQSRVIQHPNVTEEQQSDGDSEDSVEPVSGLAARVIGAERSYDRDSAAEAQRYLNATRRASARDNSNSPHTPRTTAFVLPGDPSQRSSLPPSDPPLDDTSSITHEDDRADLPPSEPDALPAHSEARAHPAPEENADIDEGHISPPEVGHVMQASVNLERHTGDVVHVGVPTIPEVNENEEVEGVQNMYADDIAAGGADVQPAHDPQEAAFSPPKTPPRRTTRSVSRQPVARPAPLLPRRSTRRAASKPPT